MSFVVSCRSCSAPLDVPEPAAGKSTEAVVCPKCGSRTSVAKAAQGYKAVFEVATPELWLVSFGADDDRELSAEDIEVALGERRIGKATLVWRDGMDEWLPLARVPELAGLSAREPAPPPRPKPESPAQTPIATDLTGGFLGTGLSVPEEDRDFQVVALSSRLADSGKHEAAAEVSKDETPPPSSAGFLEPDALEDAPPSVAKPKVSVPPPGPRRHTEPHGKETRSLPQAKKAPLTFTEAPSDAEATSDADSEPPPSSTGIPDLRALAAQSVAPRKPSPSAIDGDLESKLAAAAAAPKGVVLESAPSHPLPVLEPDSAPSSPKPVALESRESSPPVSRKTPQPKKTKPGGQRARKDVRSVPPGATAQAKRSPKRSSSATWLLLAAALLLGFVWLGTRKPPRAEEPVATVDAVPTPPAAPVQPAPPAPPAPSAPPPSSAAAEPADDPSTPVAHAPAHRDEPPTTDSVEAAASSALEPAAGTAPDAGAAPTAEEGNAGVGEETTFDRSAAVSALAVTATEAAGCRKPGDPDGHATVVITFAPSGRVTSAVVEGPPFAGTATGGCVAATMRKTTVPPFEGAYARVTRQVWVN